MFDIGFWELCLIAVVALLILGPERLPTAARTAGLWIGKFQRMIGNVKSEIDRELQLDELRQRLKEQQSSITDMTENTISDVEKMQADMLSDINIEPNSPESSQENSKQSAKLNDEAPDDQVQSETDSQEEVASNTPSNDSGHGEYEPEMTDKS